MAVEHTFFGIVHPERCAVSVGQVEFDASFGDGNLKGLVRFSVSVSQIHAVLIAEKPIVDSYSARNFVESAVRLGLDALGYVLGCGYDVEIKSMMAPHLSKPVIFGVGIDVLKSFVSDDGIDIQSIMDIIGNPGGKYLFRSLADIREAIRMPSETAFFCYRAIESLRQFYSTGKKDNESWKKLRESLWVSRGDIDYIKEMADPIRHGGDHFILGADRVKALRITSSIVNKFVRFLGDSLLIDPVLNGSSCIDKNCLSQVFLGPFSVALRDFPHVAINQSGEEMVVVGKDGGSLWVSLKCFSEDGKLIAEIIRNRCYINSKNSYRAEFEEKRFALINDKNTVAVSVDFSHPDRLMIRGCYYLRKGVAVVIDDELLAVGNVKLRGTSSSIGVINI